ncbi:uncharacterized protein BX664DRAFT_355677 [Halteromyces radiatus]|uniref:uncharacterized protein n=1 Tax=Halteromyces radiatus TaxID=101107 RepID=UPI00221EF455|nr:uncharacterized protein BX664DRAFT_355677 [Halteromyces radiatus]KAI8096298.1 hypothetical protein BX664DRAFT_355677 [Halteromyces radiatus]
METTSAYQVIRTLPIHCPGDGSCHCDWRLTLENCSEAGVMYYVNIIHAVLSALAFIIGAAISFHRIKVKGNLLFDFGSQKGCLRPRPVDCLLFFLNIFNMLRLLSSLILILNVAPTNLIFRSWVFEIPWQFGYGGFALYLVGIAQTLADSHKKLSDGWLPGPKVVDFLGCWFFFWPFVINNIFSILAGIYATRDVYVAEICTRLLYVMWFLHNVTLTSAVAYAGYRLIKLLNHHLRKFKPTGDRYAAVRVGIFRIKLIIVICSVCLLGFASFLLLYGILRDLIMVNTPGSIFLGIVWAFLGVITTLFVELVILINPKMEKNAALDMKSSSTGKDEPSTHHHSSNHLSHTNNGSSRYATQSQGGYSIDHGTQVSFGEKEKGDMMMMNDIHEQQAQYQQVFRLHAATGPAVKLYNTDDLDDEEYDAPPRHKLNDSVITGATTVTGDGSSSMHDLTPLEAIHYGGDSDQRQLIDPFVKPMHRQWPAQ